MHWHAILAETATMAVNRVQNPFITSIVYNSRQAAPGTLFVAMRGGTADGNRFLQQALDGGTAAVLTDSPASFALLDSRNFPVALVKHGRRALAQASAALLGHPERQLALTAVTGTNGKTTTAWLTEQLLQQAGRTTVLIGTIETHIAGRVRPTEHTTPESRDLLQIFREGVDLGATEAVMEMSSHALDQERVYGLPVDTAIFTNLTQDHLDYHGTMDAYAAAKARLFGGIGASPPRIAILNADDPYFRQMQAAASACETVWTCSLLDPNASFFASDLHYPAGQTGFALQTPFGAVNLLSNLAGRVNVYNLLSSIAAALARGLDLQTITTAIPQLRPVPGRFETVPNTLGLTVIVDYAHTDDALRNLLTLARELTNAQAHSTKSGAPCLASETWVPGGRELTKAQAYSTESGAPCLASETWVPGARELTKAQAHSTESGAPCLASETWVLGGRVLTKAQAHSTESGAPCLASETWVPGARVLTLFGCGGDRDRTKRPKMGRVAAQLSDLVLITSDNPRSEDPAAIAAEAMGGVQETGRNNATITLDRAAAIHEILAEARPGDVVLIAGKGHEKTQTAQGIAVPFDDVAIAATALRALEAADSNRKQKS